MVNGNPFEIEISNLEKLAAEQVLLEFGHSVNSYEGLIANFAISSKITPEITNAIQEK